MRVAGGKEPNASDSGPDEHTDPGQRAVVAGAWNYLCPDTREGKTTRFPDED